MYSQSSQNDNYVTNRSQLRENSLRTTSEFRMELMEGSPSKISVRNDIQYHSVWWENLFLISSYIIISYNELLALSFPSFDLTRSFQDFVDPHGWVVSYLLTLFLHSSSQNRSFSQIPFGMSRKVRQSVVDGLSGF